MLTMSIARIKECQNKAHTGMSKTNNKLIEGKENYIFEDASHKDIPDTQRALVLQGGGALGAYEVGVLKVLCKNLPKKQGNPRRIRPSF